MIFIYFDLKVWLVQTVSGGAQKSSDGAQKSSDGAEPHLAPM